MQTVDPLFLESLRYSNTVVSQLDLYTGTTLIQAGVPISEGTVTAARKSNARRTFTAVIGLNQWESTPIDCYSSRVQVWVGMEVVPGVNKMLSQGVFRVEELTRAKVGAVGISGTSLESFVIDDRFFTPRTPATGSGTIASIKTLITESFPTAGFIVTATKDKTIAMTAPWERERWEAITALADSIDAEVYCNPNGLFVIADKPNFAVLLQNPMWSLDEGPTGIRISENVVETRDKVYNAVVASGQSSDKDIPPVWDVVVDNDPKSKTYWSGLFGHVPRFYTNPNFTTKAHCTAAATSMLAESIAENRNVDFTLLPNPALEPGDTVQVNMMDGSIENHVIDELSFPLGLGAYAAKTLASKVELKDSGP